MSTTAISSDEVRRLMQYLTPAEREELEALVSQDLSAVVWRPLPGPQVQAYYSEADVVGFGGAAGGGKTDLALGLALTAHERVQFVRREGPQLQGVLDRLREITGEEARGKPPVFRSQGVQISFNSVPNAGDEVKHQGIPKDLLVIDEAANMLESQVRFLKGWVRTTTPGQRTRTLLTFNPPTTAEGRWIVEFFAPWLDKRHPLYPTPPGELRWAFVDPATGKDVWLEPGERTDSFVFTVDGERNYDYDIAEISLEDIVTPESRTFIPSRISDNPYLVGTGYIATLQAMPEPLRSQMLYGDFEAGMQDDPWQVIPTEWVDAAMERWSDTAKRGELLALGVDIARGGQDDTVVAKRYEGGLYDLPEPQPGKETPDGARAAAFALAHWRDDAPILIDVIGVGASPYDILRSNGLPAYAVDVRQAATALDKSGKLHFSNMRTQLWWQFREALDPGNPEPVSLPPIARLARELCAPRFELRGSKLYVESREDLIKRLGYSPDMASAVIMARIEIPKIAKLRATSEQAEVLSYDPYDNL